MAAAAAAAEGGPGAAELQSKVTGLGVVSFWRCPSLRLAVAPFVHPWIWICAHQVQKSREKKLQGSLAPSLRSLVARSPGVQVAILEAYSLKLERKVADLQEENGLLQQGVATLQRVVQEQQALGSPVAGAPGLGEGRQGLAGARGRRQGGWHCLAGSGWEGGHVCTAGAPGPCDWPAARRYKSASAGVSHSQSFSTFCTFPLHDTCTCPPVSSSPAHRALRAAAGQLHLPHQAAPAGQRRQWQAAAAPALLQRLCGGGRHSPLRCVAPWGWQAALAAQRWHAHHLHALGQSQRLVLCIDWAPGLAPNTACQAVLSGQCGKVTATPQTHSLRPPPTAAEASTAEEGGHRRRSTGSRRGTQPSDDDTISLMSLSEDLEGSFSSLGGTALDRTPLSSLQVGRTSPGQHR